MLIGAGSFGRVYSGRWRETDVAIKKILHSPAESDKIFREIHLSMAFQHPNVVRSLHYVSNEHLPPGGSVMAAVHVSGWEVVAVVVLVVVGKVCHIQL